MKIALAQMKMTPEMEINYQKSISLIEEAAQKGASLILFPEIQLTPFFPQFKDENVSDYVMTIDDPYVEGICRACRKNRIFASPNIYIEENGKKYDMSLLINDENFYEQTYYEPSEDGFPVFDTKLGRIAIVVCFDRHYPESIRTEALHGAELILIPTANTSAEPSELFQWEIKIQAFQNSVNIAMCNRVGKEGDMEFSGESIVSDYQGKTVAIAGRDEELLITEVNLSDATITRKKKPYISLRKPELYS